MDSSTSWVVAAGCCWANFFSYAIFRSAAIVYVAILNSLDTTRAEAAWPLTIMGILTVSGLVFPPLLQFLIENYGPKGMFLVTGALMLNATGGALLQRLPPETPRKPASVPRQQRWQSWKRGARVDVSQRR